MIKRILILLVSLAILLAIVNLAKAAPATPRPVCQINGNILSVAKTATTTPALENESQVVDSYDVQIKILSSFILSGQEYGDCSYLGSEISAKYLLEQYEKQPLQVNQEIIAKMEFLGDERFHGLMLSEVMVTSVSSQTQDVILLNSKSLSLTADEVADGQKFKVFDNKFIFQIDKEMIDQSASLTLNEIILPPGSLMAPPKGLQLEGRVYEYDFQTTNSVDFGKAFWFSLKYDSNDYFRKNIYYWDEANKKWSGLEGVIKDGLKKIVVNTKMAKAKVVILKDIDIMTEGTASWYKYKGCNCAASPDYPKGTKLKVTNLQNNKSVVVKVNDWGPDRSIHPDRVIDLDVVAFKKIASKSAGLCKVKVELVPVTTALK